jgi:hypothetical protein
MRAFASAKLRCGAVVFAMLGFFVEIGLPEFATLAAAGSNGLPDAAADAAAAADVAAAEAKAAEDAAPRPEEVMRAFASAKVRCGAVFGFIVLL